MADSDPLARYRPTQNQADEYHRLAHALQSGVATEQDLGSADGSPKHLRVGVNMRAVEYSALTRLLVDAGVISNDALWDSILQQLRDEVAAYEERLTRKTGTRITLA